MPRILATIILLLSFWETGGGIRVMGDWMRWWLS